MLGLSHQPYRPAIAKYGTSKLPGSASRTNHGLSPRVYSQAGDRVVLFGSLKRIYPATYLLEGKQDEQIQIVTAPEASTSPSKPIPLAISEVHSKVDHDDYVYKDVNIHAFELDDFKKQAQLTIFKPSTGNGIIKIPLQGLWIKLDIHGYTNRESLIIGRALIKAVLQKYQAEMAHKNLILKVDNKVSYKLALDLGFEPINNAANMDAISRLEPESSAGNLTNVRMVLPLPAALAIMKDNSLSIQPYVPAQQPVVQLSSFTALPQVKCGDKAIKIVIHDNGQISEAPPHIQPNQRHMVLSYAGALMTGIDTQNILTYRGARIKNAELLLEPGDEIILGNSVYLYGPEGLWRLSDNAQLYRHMFNVGLKDLLLHQQNIGDCYFLASLRALAQFPIGKQLIANMIRINQHGNYAIRFPGFPQDEIIVPKQNISLKEGVASLTGIKILEKAFAELRAKYSANKHQALKKAITAGHTTDALYALTGWAPDAYVLKDTDSNVNTQLLNRLAENQDVMVLTASTVDEKTLEGFKEVSHSTTIYSDHAYAVQSINPHRRTITLINPHESGRPFTISYTQFFKYFSDMASLECPSHSL